MNNKAFTVIIPTKNEERFIGNSVRSVLDVCGGSVHEIIVVDNHSTDRTREVAESAGARFIRCGGTIAAQRNAGAKLAQTEYIAFLDADCTVRANWSETSINWLLSDDVVAVGAKPDAPIDQSTWVQSTWCFIKKSSSSGPSEVKWLSSCNLWVKLAPFNAIGGFDESFETCEDADLGYRISRLGRIISDPGIAVVHFREPASIKQFYHKEVWHGKNSLDGVLRGRLTLHELPSLLSPLIFGIALISSAIAVFQIAIMSQTSMLAAFIPIAIAIPFIYTLRAHFKKSEWFRFPQVFLVYTVYFLARFVALVKYLIPKKWSR